MLKKKAGFKPAYFLLIYPRYDNFRTWLKILLNLLKLNYKYAIIYNNHLN